MKELVKNLTQRLFKLVLLVISFLIINPRSYSQPFPYQDVGLPIEARVSDLLSRMAIEEKVAQMSMASLKDLEVGKDGKVTETSLKKVLGGYGVGCLESPFIGVEDISKLSEAADNYLRSNTRLGIPAIQIAECLHGLLAHGATIFPQAVAQGSTWNSELIKKMGRFIAKEANSVGVDQALSPLFDLARDPRYGRVEECFGEDPFLVAEIGKAFVNGMQGSPDVTKDKIPGGHIMCTAKHYVGYSTPVAGINLGPVEISMRGLRSLHLYPFEKAVKEANIYSVMPSYNEVNGIPLHANQYFLRDILRDEYGFQGYVLSDYSAIWMLESFHKTSSDRKETAFQALNAGVDLEAPKPYAYPELLEMAEKGGVPVKLIDEAVENILTVKFEAGLFDKSYVIPESINDSIHTSNAIQLAREIAEESTVLLKNENGILPLDITKLSSVAVIGPNADRVQYGDYSWTKDKSTGVTILEGIKKLASGKLIINYAEGCGITNTDTTGFRDAIKVAEQSDVVVLAVGGTSMILSGIGWGNKAGKDYATCGEGFDRASLEPPGVQPQLIREIYKTGKPVILVLVNGRAYDLSWEKKHIPAILEAWYPGEQGGNAVARILFGEVNPSGKLPVTFPQSVGHVPVVYNHKPSGRGYYHQPGSKNKPGRDYVFSSTEPLFPFGFGLSYTQFEYSGLKIKSKNLSASDTIKLSLQIKNTGDISGKEVVQLYINDKVSSVTTPIKVLKGFKKIGLEPGQSETMEFQVPVKELGLWDKNMHFVVEPGEFELMVGASCEDIRLKELITVK